MGWLLKLAVMLFLCDGAEPMQQTPMYSDTWPQEVVTWAPCMGRGIACKGRNYIECRPWSSFKALEEDEDG